MRYLPVLVLCLCFPLWGFGPRPKIYIFLPSNIRPHALQNGLKRACPEMDLIVLGRFREMQRMLEESPADAIIAPAAVVDGTPEYQMFLVGAREARRKETYVLLAVDQEIGKEQLKKGPLGVVDLMGRKQMQSFLAGQLNLDSLRIRTVTKREDLLSLLQFQDVEAVLIPESSEPYFRGRSRLKLVTTRTKIKVGLPVIALRTVDPALIRIIHENFMDINRETNLKLMGVDTWERP